MASQNISSVKTIVVAKSGTADYRTIGEAIKNVEPETRILVQLGLYQKSIAIDKPIEILGSGRVCIESYDASCIVMQTKYALVRGLTLRKFIIFIICQTVLLGLNLPWMSNLIFNFMSFKFWEYLLLLYAVSSSCWLIVKYVFYPALKQAKLISNYDIKQH